MSRSPHDTAAQVARNAEPGGWHSPGSPRSGAELGAKLSAEIGTELGTELGTDLAKFARSGRWANTGPETWTLCNATH